MHGTALDVGEQTGESDRQENCTISSITHLHLPQDQSLNLLSLSGSWLASVTPCNRAHPGKQREHQLSRMREVHFHHPVQRVLSQ